MSASGTIQNLQQALDCAGKCDCCNKLQNQINSLNQKISTLESKFVTKQEFTTYKQYVENSFNGIAKAIQFLKDELFKKAGYQEVFNLNDGLDRVRNALNELRGRKQDTSNLESRINQLERRVDYNYQDDRRQDSGINSTRAKVDEVAGDLWALRRDFNYEKLANTAEHNKLWAAITGLQNLLRATIAGLPTLIQSIVWSILASAAFNALIYGIIGAFNSRIGQDAWNLALRALGLAKEAKDDARSAATIAVKAEGKADTADAKATKALDEIEWVKRTALDAMKRLEAEIKFLTEATRQVLLRLQARIENLEKYVGDLSTIVQGMQNVIAGLQSQINQLTTYVNTQIKKLQATVDKFKTDILKELDKLKPLVAKIPEMLGQIALFTAQIAALWLAINGIKAFLEKIRPGGTVVQNYITNNYDQRRTTIVNNPSPQPVDLSLLKKIDNTTTANLAVSGANLQISNVMNLKLGAQLKDGLAGWMTRFTQWDIVNRAINLMTLAATIHNATMLSSAIVDTLIQSIQNIVNFFELKDSEGKGYDISELIKNSISQFIKSIVGEANYTVLSTAWKNANRIYQAAGNLFSSLLNMGDSITNALQVIGGQTGKIGNALRLWGIVGEKAYGWFNPTPNFNNPLLTKLNSIQETSSVVENVTQQPLTVKAAKEEVESSSKELADSLAQIEGKPQGKEFPEAGKVKQEQEKAKEDSQPKPFTFSDLFDGEDL